MNIVFVLSLETKCHFSNLSLRIKVKYLFGIKVVVNMLERKHVLLPRIKAWIYLDFVPRSECSICSSGFCLQTVHGKALQDA